MAKPGDRIDGFEAMGGLVFEEISLKPGEKSILYDCFGMHGRPGVGGTGRRAAQGTR